MIALKHTFSNGKSMVFAGTHLCHEFEDNRIAQAHQIAQLLKELHEPVVIGGDFNMRPETKPYKEISANLQDAAKLYGNPQFTFPFTSPRIRLDYIFCDSASWRVKDVQVIKVDASDHMPVLVKLELR